MSNSGKQTSMSATQSEIARTLGLSQAAVSMALRGEGKINSRTRKQVLDQAAKLGYRHNNLAQALRHGRYGNISLLLNTHKEYSFLPIDLLRGIQRQVREHDTQLTINEVPDEILLNEKLVHEMLREWSSDGLLIDYTHNLPQRVHELLRTYRLPCVWINSNLETDCVNPDDLATASQATQHLLDLGHQRIGYIDLTRTTHYSIRDRYDGYVETIHAAGFQPCLLTIPTVRSERLDVLRKWLRSDNRPTAVITYEDREAVPLFVAALEMGLRVPEDLSIVAIHDRVVDSVGIPLATMQIDFAQVGATAVNMLIKKIIEPNVLLPSQKVQPIWNPGQTCAPPKKPDKSGNR
jgi:DNA-binding LacI/PurR family transcriptional regulator